MLKLDIFDTTSSQNGPPADILCRFCSRRLNSDDCLPVANSFSDVDELAARIGIVDNRPVDNRPVEHRANSLVHNADLAPQSAAAAKTLELRVANWTRHYWSHMAAAHSPVFAACLSAPSDGTVCAGP